MLRGGKTGASGVTELKGSQPPIRGSDAGTGETAPDPGGPDPLDRPATDVDVLHCYHLLLGREPENGFVLREAGRHALRAVLGPILGLAAWGPSLSRGSGMVFGAEAVLFAVLFGGLAIAMSRDDAVEVPREETLEDALPAALRAIPGVGSVHAKTTGFEQRIDLALAPDPATFTAVLHAIAASGALVRDLTFEGADPADVFAALAVHV